MSLTEFIKRPRVSAAFDEFATKERTPKAYRGRPLVVADAGGPRGSAGAAFDYLARAKLARELKNASITTYRQPWLSARIQSRLYPNVGSDSGYDVGDNERWHELLRTAHTEFDAYIDGSDEPSRIAIFAQYMAHTDLLHRTMFGFDVRFTASDKVSAELVEMLRRFKPATQLAPSRYVILNPEFRLAEEVGGADADLIVDDRLIELKTTTRLSVTKSILLQLAGYAVLHDLGGVEGVDAADLKPLTQVEIYFARHEVLVEIPLSELFPGEGYLRFQQTFVEEIEELQRERREWQRRFDERYPTLARYRS